MANGYYGESLRGDKYYDFSGMSDVDKIRKRYEMGLEPSPEVAAAERKRLGISDQLRNTQLGNYMGTETTSIIRPAITEQPPEWLISANASTLTKARLGDPMALTEQMFPFGPSGTTTMSPRRRNEAELNFQKSKADFLANILQSKRGGEQPKPPMTSMADLLKASTGEDVAKIMTPYGEISAKYADKYLTELQAEKTQDRFEDLGYGQAWDKVDKKVVKVPTAPRDVTREDKIGQRLEKLTETYGKSIEKINSEYSKDLITVEEQNRRIKETVKRYEPLFNQYGWTLGGEPPKEDTNTIKYDAQGNRIQ